MRSEHVFRPLKHILVHFREVESILNRQKNSKKNDFEIFFFFQKIEIFGFSGARSAPRSSVVEVQKMVVRVKKSMAFLSLCRFL